MGICQNFNGSMSTAERLYVSGLGWREDAAPFLLNIGRVVYEVIGHVDNADWEDYNDVSTCAFSTK